MELVNVLVTSPIGEECLQKIASIGRRIKVTDISPLFRIPQSYAATEESSAPGDKEKLDALLAEAEVVCGGRLPRNLFVRAPRLKWIQVLSAGVDRYLTPEMIASPVTLTNVSGIHAVPISEFVLCLILMFVKQAPLCFQLKQEKRWRQWREAPPQVLRSKTVGIVGLGSIGQEVARLAKAFGMRVLATRRSVRQVGKTRYVDIMLPSAQLHRLLSESDFVVLTLPLTPATRKLIGEKELRAMKASAFLINIARGALVDEEVLIRALEEHWIAGAGLDVFAIEPLPQESRLWVLPNVILSPHLSGGTEDYFMKATEVFVENLRRYLSGQRLRHVVNKKHGY